MVEQIKLGERVSSASYMHKGKMIHIEVFDYGLVATWDQTQHNLSPLAAMAYDMAQRLKSTAYQNRFLSMLLEGQCE